MVRKKPHRRGPYACDECHLRKRAYDTTKPCSSCQRNGIECTYDFRRHVPRPTTKIRALQSRLRQAHGWMQHILPQGVPDLDLAECIQILDFNLPENDASSSPPLQAAASSAGCHVPAAGKLTAPSREQGLYIPNGVRMGRSRFYYGPLSDVAFILRTVETLQVAPSGTSLPNVVQHVSVISDLTDQPVQREFSCTFSGGLDLAHELPPNAHDLVSSVLARQQLMLSFLSGLEELEFSAESHRSVRNSVDRLGLLHSILALAYLYDSGGYLETGCEASMQNAAKHFDISVGLDALGHASEEVSLATKLCGTVFLLAVARNSMAYSLCSSACSSALRLGLIADHDLPDELPIQARKIRFRLLASTLCLDMMTSIILDLPPSFSAHHASSAKMSSLAHVAKRAACLNSTAAKRSPAASATCARLDIFAAVLLRQAALLAIPLSVRNDPGPRHHGNEDDHQMRLFRSALHDFQKLANEATSLMTKLTGSERLQSLKKELEITYHFSHVILFRPHLYYIRDMYAGKRISLAESYYALACIKAASSIIPLAESTAPLPESWLALHAVFSAVMCLVFLVAAHPSTTLPSVAWQRARRGTRIIAANRCVDNAATTWIEILKVIVHTLRQTVYIDFDRIEAMTGSRCNSNTTRKGRGRAGESSASQENSPAVTDDSDYVMGNAQLGQVHNEADRMLEQAEALEVDMNFQDWLNLDDYGE